MLDETTLRKLATRRDELHRNSPTNRPLSDESSNFVGLCGENVFAVRYRLSLDLVERKGGDGGKDFVLHTTMGDFITDIKTAKIPGHLLVEASKTVAGHLYVLSGFRSPLDVPPLGWEMGGALMRTEAKDYGGKGVISHGIKRGLLFPIRWLDSIVIS